MTKSSKPAILSNQFDISKFFDTYILSVLRRFAGRNFVRQQNCRMLRLVKRPRPRQTAKGTQLVLDYFIAVNELPFIIVHLYQVSTGRIS